MTEEEYELLIRKEGDGNLLIGIDRAFARRFYTDLPTAYVQLETGESPYVEKAIVNCFFVASPICLLIAAALAVWCFSWWSILIVPGIILTWLVYGASSSMGTSQIGTISLMLIAALALLLFDPSSRWFSPFLVLLILAFWLNRFMYITATVFLRAFVLRNQKAFALVHDHLTLRYV